MPPGVPPGPRIFSFSFIAPVRLEALIIRESPPRAGTVIRPLTSIRSPPLAVPMRNHLCLPIRYILLCAEWPSQEGIVSGMSDNTPLDQLFDQLADEAAACEVCERMRERKAVLGHLNGTLNPQVMFIGEAPGRKGA